MRLHVSTTILAPQEREREIGKRKIWGREETDGADRQTDRQTDRQRDRETDRERQRQKQKHTHTHTKETDERERDARRLLFSEKGKKKLSQSARRIKLEHGSYLEIWPGRKFSCRLTSPMLEIRCPAALIPH